MTGSPLGFQTRRRSLPQAFSKPLKLLRKTTASLLDGEPEYGRYVNHFLGHAPRSIGERHYVTPSAERFDEAIAWLGHQYGYVSKSADSIIGQK